jgi:hypothetical protein
VRHPCVSKWSRNEIALLTAQAAEPAGTTRDIYIAPSDDPFRATITGEIVFEQRGTYDLRLATAKEGGEFVPFGEPIEFRVNWIWSDYVKSVANEVWPFLLGAHTLLFVGLIVGARWSDRCWRLTRISHSE